MRVFPQWTLDCIDTLEVIARKRDETNIECWRARAEPLPLSHVITAEAKTYTGSWREIELKSPQHPDYPNVRGVVECIPGVRHGKW